MVVILALIQVMAKDLFFHLNYDPQNAQIYHHYLFKGYQYLFGQVNLHLLQ